MYARRQTRPKPRKSELKKFVAPTAGWIANRALSDPSSLQGPGAIVLDNFFPRATGVALRRGKQRYATLVQNNLDVTSLFAYRNGSNERLFGANDNFIYDLTNVIFPDDSTIVTEANDAIATTDGDTFGWASTFGLDVAGGFTGGDWITTQFATTGNVYLIGVNGQDTGFIFDGVTFFPYVSGGVTRLNYDAETAAFTEGDVVTGGTSGATATIWRVVDQGGSAGYLYITGVAGGPFQDNEPITDTDGGAALVNGVSTSAAPGIEFPAGQTTADMSFVWVYKNRLYFIERNSLNAWYMVDVDVVGGDMDILPFGGIMPLGGALLWGSSWSMDSSGDGGLSDQCVFTSTLGEVAVFQGSDPGSASEWNKVGQYRIGTPLGKRAFFRGGGDIAIATSVGLVPLSKAISLDITALSVATVSYNIADAWSEALTLRGDQNWVCELWADGKMALISPPNIVGADEPILFVSNTETGAWARFTGWQALAMETFRGLLYFGSTEGRVFIANVSGLDDGATYSGAVMPLYEDFGSPASAKIGTVGRARSRANSKVNDWVTLKVDFDESLPPAPDATQLVGSNLWDQGVWGTSLWGEKTPTVINQDWNSVGGIGYSISICYQVTSGSIGPIDVELIDMELMYTTAEMVT